MNPHVRLSISNNSLRAMKLKIYLYLRFGQITTSLGNMQEELALHTFQHPIELANHIHNSPMKIKI